MEGDLLTRDTVVSEWMKLRSNFMREDIIRSSFEKTGIYPLNPNAFTEEDFAPSRAFSIQGQLPAGYPVTYSDEAEYDSDTENENELAFIESTELAQSPTVTPAGAFSRGQMSTPAPQISIHSEVKQEEDITLKNILPSPGTALNTKSQLTAEVIRLCGDLESCIAQRESACAHASLMAKQNAELQKKINTKKRNRRKKLTTDSRLVTSDEYVNIRRMEREDEERKAKILEEKAQQRRSEEARRERERAEGAHSLTWSSGWRNKRKEDLKDLCYALELSMEGTRDAMVKRIETYLAEKPEIVGDNRFRALFASKPVTNPVSSQVTGT
ncbi:hypothetical protein RSOL_404490, partial [Rhizoctonia solani AG-3 Rhs1AP]